MKKKKRIKNNKKGLRFKYGTDTKSNIIIILIICLIVIFIAPKMMSAAKYVYNYVYEHYLASKDFYFSSDKLSANHTEYEVTNNWSGAETYTVPINMTSKKNDLYFTAADIEYDITVTCSDNITYTKSKNSGTIPGTDTTQGEGANEDAFSVTISPVGGTLADGSLAWIEVVASATSPYTQQISGKLIFDVGAANIRYEIIDAVQQPFFTVNVINSTSTSANVTLSYNPQNVLLDMTSRFNLNKTSSTTQQINNHTYLNSVTGAVGGLSTTSVKFYKKDPTQNYSYSGGSGTPVVTLSH